MADGTGFALLHTLDAAVGGIGYVPDPMGRVANDVAPAPTPSLSSEPDEDEDVRAWAIQDAIDRALGQLGVTAADRVAVHDIVSMLLAGRATRELALSHVSQAAKKAERFGFHPFRPEYETWAQARADVWRQVKVYRAELRHRPKLFVLSACLGILHGLVHGTTKLWSPPPGAANELAAMRISDAVMNESLDQGAVLFRIFRALGMPKKAAEARARGAEYVRTSRATKRRLAAAKSGLTLRRV